MAHEIGKRYSTAEIAQSREVEHTISRAAYLHRGRGVRRRGAGQDEILRVARCWSRGNNLSGPPSVGSRIFADTLFWTGRRQNRNVRTSPGLPEDSVF